MQGIIANEAEQMERQKQVLHDLQQQTTKTIQISRQQVFVPAETGMQFTESQLHQQIAKAAEQLVEHMIDQTKQQEQKIDMLIESSQHIIQSLAKVTQQELDHDKQQLIPQTLELQKKYQQVEVQVQKSMDLMERQLISNEQTLLKLKDATSVITPQVKKQIKPSEQVDQPFRQSYKRNHPVKQTNLKMVMQQIDQQMLNIQESYK